MIVTVYEDGDALVRKVPLVEALVQVAREINGREDEDDFVFHFAIVERE